MENHQKAIDDQDSNDDSMQGLLVSYIKIHAKMGATLKVIEVATSVVTSIHSL